MHEATAVRQHDRFGIAGLCVVGLAAAILSLSIVRDLAVAAGVPKSIAWLFWISLDVYGALAMRSAFKARTETVRSWAGASSVFALVLSAGAAGCHVFIEGGLPKPLAFAVLCTPALMLGLSLHLVLLMALENRSPAATGVRMSEGSDAGSSFDEPERVQASVEVTERVTERVSERKAVARSTGTGKMAAFIQALKAAEPDAGTPAVDVVAELNRSIQLSEPTARKLVAQYRRGELS